MLLYITLSKIDRIFQLFKEILYCGAWGIALSKGVKYAFSTSCLSSFEELCEIPATADIAVPGVIGQLCRVESRSDSGQMKGSFPSFFLSQSRLRRTPRNPARRLTSRYLPGRERRRRPSRIVRSPWPGRKSMAMPASSRRIPRRFRMISKKRDRGVRGRARRLFSLNLRK